MAYTTEWRTDGRDRNRGSCGKFKKCIILIHELAIPLPNNVNIFLYPKELHSFEKQIESSQKQITILKSFKSTIKLIRARNSISRRILKRYKISVAFTEEKSINSNQLFQQLSRLNKQQLAFTYMLFTLTKAEKLDFFRASEVKDFLSSQELLNTNQVDLIFTHLKYYLRKHKRFTKLLGESSEFLFRSYHLFISL